MPLSAGGLNATLMRPWPGVATGWAGVAGSPTTTTTEGSDWNEMPCWLTAWTKQAYAAPFVRPVTTIGATVPEVVALPATPLLDCVGKQVATYAVIGNPPSLAGAEKVT